MDKRPPIDRVRVAVKAVIVLHGHVLLLRRAEFPGAANALKYSFPGGAMEPGETLLEALKREVSEETALEIDVKGLIAVGEWQAARHRAYYVGLFFACNLIDTKSSIILNDENCEYKWANVLDVRQLELVDSTQDIIAQCLSTDLTNLSTTVSTVHNLID